MNILTPGCGSVNVHFIFRAFNVQSNNRDITEYNRQVNDVFIIIITIINSFIEEISAYCCLSVRSLY